MNLIRASRTLAAEAARSHRQAKCAGPSNCPLCRAILDVEVELTRAEQEAAFESAPVPPFKALCPERKL